MAEGVVKKVFIGVGAEESGPDRFDWVDSYARCSIDALFADLAEQVEGDVEKLNKLDSFASGSSVIIIGCPRRHLSRIDSYSRIRRVAGRDGAHDQDPRPHPDAGGSQRSTSLAPRIRGAGRGRCTGSRRHRRGCDGRHDPAWPLAK